LDSPDHCLADNCISAAHKLCSNATGGKLHACTTTVTAGPKRSPSPGAQQTASNPRHSCPPQAHTVLPLKHAFTTANTPGLQSETGKDVCIRWGCQSRQQRQAQSRGAAAKAGCERQQQRLSCVPHCHKPLTRGSSSSLSHSHKHVPPAKSGSKITCQHCASATEQRALGCRYPAVDASTAHSRGLVVPKPNQATPHTPQPGTPVCFAQQRRSTVPSEAKACSDQDRPLQHTHKGCVVCLPMHIVAGQCPPEGMCAFSACTTCSLATLVKSDAL
jgi:hypothetical protein